MLWHIESTYEEYLRGEDAAKVPIWPECHKCHKLVDRIVWKNHILSNSQTITFYHHHKFQRIRIRNATVAELPRRHFKGKFWHAVFIVDGEEIQW